MRRQASPPIAEVVLGAKAKDGGTRRSIITIGGGGSNPWKKKNPPVIAYDVFDSPPPLPSSVRSYYKEVMNDAVAWAQFVERKFKAKVITLHLVGASPMGENKSVRELCSLVEDILQAVKVPLIIGGCGDPQKDQELLPAVAEVASGERCLFSALTPEMEVERIANSMLSHNHCLLTLVSMNVDEMRYLNRRVLKAGLPPSQLAMDLFTAGIGYGVEYTIATFRKARVAGVSGIKELAVPIVAAPSNAWSCREAWKSNPDWGPKELRGPLWEQCTAALSIAAGADLLMMLHPMAISKTTTLIKTIYGKNLCPFNGFN